MICERCGFVAAATLVALSGIGRPAAAQNCSATRSLPPYYAPGVAFMVTVEAVPSSSTEVYAVEDLPPAGWVGSDVSHGGLFDGATGKVKWGFFFDDQPRVLTYLVAPPPGTADEQCFGPGVVSCDGDDEAIAGDECVGPKPVPAVSTWGLVATTLLLLTVGTLVFNRSYERENARP